MNNNGRCIWIDGNHAEMLDELGERTGISGQVLCEARIRELYSHVFKRPNPKSKYVPSSWDRFMKILGRDLGERNPNVYDFRWGMGIRLNDVGLRGV